MRLRLRVLSGGIKHNVGAQVGAACPTVSDLYTALAACEARGELPVGLG